MEEYFPRNTFQDTVALLNPELGLQEGQALSYIVLDKIFRISKTDIIVNRQFFPDSLQKKKYNLLVKRLLDNEPIQYIFKEAEFYGYRFYVDKNVLIPRQETELLIQIISNFRKWEKPKMADIGTGSGCIACSLALTINDSQLVGYDVSHEALKIAQYNAARLGANAVFSPLDILKHEIPHKELDLIVSNPPYVMDQEKQLMKKNVLEFEPSLALFVPDNDPLIFYKTIMQKAKDALKKGGVLFFEINEQFGKQTLLLFQHYGYSEPKIYKDLNDKQRFASAILE
ncbi:release factor glutamine methyltransferase [Reichenbachiella faecimaris]|uniref:peptide chain release factor N(5)-glutamine methyltransferase n=1 Tax=Reichenbachiella faecimaris TaxID=692418 RepID=A0A1W2GIT6_REIFA|nr:peptide chain release factor N(5)-glutamine methyltransferase [Reichenbachiella faecimaris]SMD36186.1 release factor glutamine methyltransferase [Reichenbachiella faecimaris]